MPDIFISPQNQPAVPDNKKPDSGSRMGQLLSSYIYKPIGVRFQTQGDDEEIILLLRAHWITNVLWLLFSFILIITPVILFPAVFASGLLPFVLPSNILTFIILVWYLLTFSFMMVKFLLWYFTVSIVTNERIVDIDYINILNKKFSETTISRIEDVTLREGGLVMAIFDFGDVIVQTAGTEVQFVFGDVPHPEQVVKIINGLMEGVTEAPQP